MNLARLDLNLLVALDALLGQRSVTRAAEQMGLSQPALSASLGRLRRHFGDELLVRVGNEYRLSPLAAQLREQTRVALAGVERVFGGRPDFDPALSDREFSLVTSDYWLAVHGAAVVGLIAREAPGARVRLVPNTTGVVDDAQQTLLGRDLLLMPHGFLTDLRHRDLSRDEWVFVVARENAQVGAEVSVEQLGTLPWVVSYHGPTAATPAARQLRLLGVEPRVQVVTETFLSVPALVAGSGRIALLQKGLLTAMPDLMAGLRVVPGPFALAPLVEAMWWHPIYDEDPAHAWLREAVRRAVAGPGAGDPAVPPQVDHKSP